VDAITFIILFVGFTMIATAIIICIDETITENKEDEIGEM
jgi:hypothetical protein